MISPPRGPEAGLRLREKCDLPAATRVNLRYTTGTSAHLRRSPVVEQITGEERERKKPVHAVPALNRSGEQTANCRQRSLVAVATGGAVDTNIGESLRSLSLTGITCAETSITRPLLTFPRGALLFFFSEGSQRGIQQGTLLM